MKRAKYLVIVLLVGLAGCGSSPTGGAMDPGTDDAGTPGMIDAATSEVPPADARAIDARTIDDARVSDVTTPPTAVPGAPRSVHAVAGDGEVTVSWSAPASPGSGPILSYVVHSSPGGLSLTTDASSMAAQLSGLANGTTYTFTVAATNDVGTGPTVTSNPATPSTPITTGNVPDPPTQVAVTADGTSAADVLWVAPSSDGSSPIVSYTVTASPGDLTVTTTDTASGARLTGLTPGVQYTFTVTASNSSGASPPSSPVTLTITIGNTPPPTNIVACGANGQATVSFDDVADQRYNIYWSQTEPATNGQVVRGATSPATFYNLASGTWYFAVSSNGPDGEGPVSADQVVLVDSKVHDMLLTADDTGIKIYDCYSQLPDGAPPTRVLTPPNGHGGGDIAVDPNLGMLLVGNVPNTTLGVDVYLDVANLSGEITPSYAFGSSAASSALGDAMAIDATHKIVYSHDSTNDDLVAFSYAQASDLDGPLSPSVAFGQTNFGAPSQMVVDQAIGDLYIAAGFEVTACFYLSPGCTREFPGPPVADEYLGVAYSSSRSTLYASNILTPGDSLVWTTDGSGGALDYPSAQLGSLATGNGMILAQSGSQIFAWKELDLNGNPIKTVSGAAQFHLVYIP